MQEILVIIKLKDNVFIPAEIVHTLVVGDETDFLNAQMLLAQLPTPLINNHWMVGNQLTGVLDFIRAYKNLDLHLPLVNLYYLAKKVPLVSETQTVGNFLNYFSFVYTIKNEDIEADLAPLSELFSLPVVHYWWYEGQMLLCNTTTPANPANAVNTYYDSLQFNEFDSLRGAGVTIVDAEDCGTDLKHPYLPDHLATILNGASPADNLRDHFYHTVGVLFAVPPSSGPRPIFGLAPKAQLQTLAFNNSLSPELAPTDLSQYDKFIVNFFLRFTIAKMLSEPSLTNKGNILLFERMVQIPVGNAQTYNLPLEVLTDMRRNMLACYKKKIVVIQPAGQCGNGGYDLNIKLSNISHLRGPKYTDFAKPITLDPEKKPYFGSAAVTIGALDGNNKILDQANYGDIVDAYLWGENIETITYSPTPDVLDEKLFGGFGFTSGASAIAAGIVAVLQSQAKSHGKLLTTTQLKDLFDLTFRGGRIPGSLSSPDTIFTPITLKDLWYQCMVLLRIPF